MRPPVKCLTIVVLHPQVVHIFRFLQRLLAQSRPAARKLDLSFSHDLADEGNEAYAYLDQVGFSDLLRRYEAGRHRHLRLRSAEVVKRTHVNRLTGNAYTAGVN